MVNLLLARLQGLGYTPMEASHSQHPLEEPNSHPPDPPTQFWLLPWPPTPPTCSLSQPASPRGESLLTTAAKGSKRILAQSLLVMIIECKRWPPDCQGVGGLLASAGDPETSWGQDQNPVVCVCVGGGGHSPWFWVPTAKRTSGAVAVNTV